MNEDVPKLLRTIAQSEQAKETKHDVIFDAAAAELDQLRATALRWVSEGEALPQIGQPVLLMVPRQNGGFWDLKTAQLLVAHEEVIAAPVKPGSRWPTAYYWGWGPGAHARHLVTGNSWWALFNGIALPPGAHHAKGREYYFIAQPKPVWVPGAKR